MKRVLIDGPGKWHSPDTNLVTAYLQFPDLTPRYCMQWALPPCISQTTHASLPVSQLPDRVVFGGPWLSVLRPNQMISFWGKHSSQTANSLGCSLLWWGGDLVLSAGELGATFPAHSKSLQRKWAAPKSCSWSFLSLSSSKANYFPDLFNKSSRHWGCILEPMPEFIPVSFAEGSWTTKK
jgi:hypothetical protein